LFYLYHVTTHPTATTNDDDLCEVTKTVQQPHPKPAMHMAAFFVSNKTYDVDKLCSHATDRHPGLIHITPGYVTEDDEELEYVTCNISFTYPDGVRPRWINPLQKILQRKHIANSSASSFYSVLLGMDDGEHPLGEDTGDVLMIGSKFQTGQFLSRVGCISNSSFVNQFEDIMYDNERIVTVYDKLENRSISFYHYLDCGTYFQNFIKAGGFSMKYVRAMNLDMPLKTRRTARSRADAAGKLALSK
jgi:hypothetical protein